MGNEPCYLLIEPIDHNNEKNNIKVKANQKSIDRKINKYSCASI